MIHNLHCHIFTHTGFQDSEGSYCILMKNDVNMTSLSGRNKDMTEHSCNSSQQGKSSFCKFIKN